MQADGLFEAAVRGLAALRQRALECRGCLGYRLLHGDVAAAGGASGGLADFMAWLQRGGKSPGTESQRPSLKGAVGREAEVTTCYAGVPETYAADMIFVAGIAGRG